MKLGMLFAPCVAMALAVPALTDSRIRIGTVSALYEPPESMYSQPVSMTSYHFEVNQQTGVAHVVVEFTSPVLNPHVYDPGPGSAEAEIPGLTWNATTRAVVYLANGQQTVCAVAQPGKKSKLKNTGACIVTATERDHTTNSDGGVRQIKVIDTWLEVH